MQPAASSGAERRHDAGSRAFVSVILPVFQHKDELVRCLAALREQSYVGGYEVIVVNNGAPEYLADLPAHFPEVALIHEPKPGSYNARNAGIAHAAGDLFAFTDADCLPARDWLGNGVRPLLADPTCGLVGGRIQLTPHDPARITVAELHDLMFGLNQKHYVVRRRFAATANMLTRRDVVMKVGHFRGDLRSGGDVEWGQRVSDAGYSLVYEDSATVRHPARDYPELIRKLRRTAAGERDRGPDWRSCLASCLRRLWPIPLHTLRLIAEARGLPINARQKLQLAGFVTYVRWRTAFERFRLQLARNESPRS